jgi:ribosomal-protein-alanine N-acetyltransferase
LHPISIRSIAEEYRGQLVSLINFERHVHRHLDWRSPVDWIGYQPFLVAEQRGKMVAALACPPDPHSIAWIRLYAAATPVSPKKAWQKLWPVALKELSEFTPVPMVVAMPLSQWFQSILEESGFYIVDRVVVLAWSARSLPMERRNEYINIRSMEEKDLSLVERIDQAAFSPMWQNSFTSLEIAFRGAVIATVAETTEGIVGYQISTITTMGGHLARLAVLPDDQGKGIGYSLVRDVLARFLQRGARTITVNTQFKNSASLSIYQSVDFHHTGEEFPVLCFVPE